MTILRIRMKDGEKADHSRAAWTMDQVGIWYGAWSAADFERALGNDQHDASTIAAQLSDLPIQQNLLWKVTAGYVQTALRFWKIDPNDWVLIYFDGGLGLARVEGRVLSSSEHPLNVCDEVFKYRRLRDKKFFRLSELPDAYRLISSQGRSNVHALEGMRRHVELLAACESPAAVWQRFGALTFFEFLDFLGAAAWESFAVAYLTYEEGFVPTGLAVGRTLPVVDIVGRRRADGARIVAQCKKSSQPVEISEEFVTAYGKEDVAYYFSYGGCINPPPDLKVVSREDAQSWILNTKNGKDYWQLLRAN